MFKIITPTDLNIKGLFSKTYNFRKIDDRLWFSVVASKCILCLQPWLYSSLIIFFIRTS